MVCEILYTVQYPAQRDRPGSDDGVDHGGGDAADQHEEAEDAAQPDGLDDEAGDVEAGGGGGVEGAEAAVESEDSRRSLSGVADSRSVLHVRQRRAMTAGVSGPWTPPREACGQRRPLHRPRTHATYAGDETFEGLRSPRARTPGRLRRARGAPSDEEPPGLRDAFEPVFAPVGEAQAGAGDDFDDGAGDEHLARLSLGWPSGSPAPNCI